MCRRFSQPGNEFPSQVFDPTPVDAEIPIPDSRSRANLDRFCALIDYALDIIDKTKDQAREFGMQIVVRFRDDVRSRLVLDSVDQNGQRLSLRDTVRYGIDLLRRVLGLARHTVR